MTFAYAAYCPCYSSKNLEPVQMVIKPHFYCDILIKLIIIIIMGAGEAVRLEL